MAILTTQNIHIEVTCDADGCENSAQDHVEQTSEIHDPPISFESFLGEQLAGWMFGRSVGAERGTAYCPEHAAF